MIEHGMRTKDPEFEPWFHCSPFILIKYSICCVSPIKGLLNDYLHLFLSIKFFEISDNLTAHIVCIMLVQIILGIIEFFLSFFFIVLFNDDKWFMYHL
jgi:hypothetical protein